MENKDFQAAFSAVRASRELRSEVNRIVKRENTRRTCRLLPKVLLVAAIISLLATTVMAAPMIINAIKGGRVELNKDVILELELNPDAPEDVLIHYLPEIPEGYKQTLGYKSDIERTYLWATNEEGSNFMHPDEIQFMQWPGKVWEQKDTGNGTWACWIDIPEGEKPRFSMTELGGMLGFLVESDYGYGCRIFFWSNGDYVFKLEVPDEFTDAQLAQLIESVHIVEDITPYIFKN